MFFVVTTFFLFFAAKSSSSCFSGVSVRILVLPLLFLGLTFLRGGALGNGRIISGHVSCAAVPSFGSLTLVDDVDGPDKAASFCVESRILSLLSIFIYLLVVLH